MSNDMELTKKHLVNGIATAKGVDGDFVYITVGDAKLIVQLIDKGEPKLVKTNEGRMTGYCPSCNRILGREKLNFVREPTNFCPSCGQEVKWE